VLIVSTGSRFSSFPIAEQAIVDRLRELYRGDLEFYSEYLDIVRFPSESYQRLFRDYLRDKYARDLPDLIFLIFVGNLGTAGELLIELFPRAPVVVVGLTEEELPARLRPGRVTGLAQRSDPVGTLELILRLQPDIRRIMLIGGTAEVDRQVMSRAQAAARGYAGRAEFEVWVQRSMPEILTAVSSLPPQTAILFTRMFRDGAGRAVNSSQAAQSIAKVSNVPVFVMTDTMLGTGAIGGSTVDLVSLGRRAGELADRILNGAEAKSLPLEIITQGVPVFDWRALQRWRISENRLPKNSVIRFRPLSMWEQYRWYIIASLAIFLVQGALIAGLVISRTSRRRTQNELQENQEMMEMAAKAGGLGLWARDLKGDRIWANSVLRSLFGFGQNDLLRSGDILARIHPDDSAGVVSEVQRTQDANVLFEGEFRTRLPDGRERWVLAKGGTVNVPSGRGARRMGVLLDITERKKMEEELRESEERFRIMANTAPVMIWMSGPDKLCTFFNKGWLDFTGRTLEQEVGDGWAEGVHCEDLHHCLQTYAQAFDARQEFTMEYRLRRADGEYRWVRDHGVSRFEADGAFLGYIGTVIDISEGKRSEEMLKREQAFLRQVIDINPNFIFAKDRDGRFTLVNQAVADAYGTTVEGLIGKTDADFNPNRDEVEHFHRMDLEVIDHLQERFIPEEHLTDAQGNMRWLQTVKRPIVEKDGVANQVLGASTDITARKVAEAELQRNRDELAHLTRVSTLGELAASLAHELNQPLGAILSNAEAGEMLLMAEPPALEEVREILADIRNDDRRASDVIRGLRNLLRKHEMERESLQVNDAMGEVLRLLSIDAAHRKATLKFEPAANLPLVEGDRVNLQQVVLNLVLNAIDAMAELADERRQVVVRSRSGDDGMITVSVSDCGLGVPPDKLPKLFEPFFTTKKDGMGMGLSIARTIVEAHHGRIWVENNRDVGATFYFTLPVSKKASA
jgi:PAS domain S-box-containing protein